MIKLLKTNIRMFSYQFSCLYHKLIGNFFYRIKLVMDWYFNVLRKDYDWDSAYLYKVMEYKLKRMYVALDNDVAVQEAVDMKALRLAIKLAGRLHKEQYADKSYRRHSIKWGELKTWFTPLENTNDYVKMYSSRPNAVFEDQKKQEKDELRAIFELEMKLMERDERLLFDILKKYRRHWWS